MKKFLKLLTTLLFVAVIIGSTGCKKESTCNKNGIPAAPSNLKATVYDGHIHLSWDASNDADYYEITNAFYVRDNYNICSDTCRIFLGHTTNNYYIDLYPFDSLNYYRIKAVNQNGTSLYNEISCNYWIENPKMWFYPNPTKDTIIIAGEGTLTVKNNSEEIIDEFDLYGIECYDMGLYEDGIYLLHLHSVSGETVRRVVVNHDWGYGYSLK